MGSLRTVDAVQYNRGKLLPVREVRERHSDLVLNEAVMPVQPQGTVFPELREASAAVFRPRLVVGLALAGCRWLRY